MDPVRTHVDAALRAFCATLGAAPSDSPLAQMHTRLGSRAFAEMAARGMRAAVEDAVTWYPNDLMAPGVVAAVVQTTMRALLLEDDAQRAAMRGAA